MNKNSAIFVTVICASQAILLIGGITSVTYILLKQNKLEDKINKINVNNVNNDNQALTENLIDVQKKMSEVIANTTNMGTILTKVETDMSNVKPPTSGMIEVIDGHLFEDNIAMVTNLTNNLTIKHDAFKVDVQSLIKSLEDKFTTLNNDTKLQLDKIKFLENNTLAQTNIDSLTNFFNLLKNNVTICENKIETLQQFTTTHKLNTTISLEKLENNVTTIIDSLENNEVMIDSLDNMISKITTDMISLEGNVDTNEDSINSLQNVTAQNTDRINTLSDNFKSYNEVMLNSLQNATTEELQTIITTFSGMLATLENNSTEQDEMLLKMIQEVDDTTDSRLDILESASLNTLSNCSWSDYVNTWDMVIDWTAPTGSVVTGTYSYHSDTHEDRVWRFKYCYLSAPTTTTTTTTTAPGAP